MKNTSLKVGFIISLILLISWLIVYLADLFNISESVGFYLLPVYIVVSGWTILLGPIGFIFALGGLKEANKEENIRPRLIAYFSLLINIAFTLIEIIILTKNY